MITLMAIAIIYTTLRWKCWCSWIERTRSSGSGFVTFALGSTVLGESLQFHLSLLSMPLSAPFLVGPNIFFGIFFFFQYLRQAPSKR